MNKLDQPKLIAELSPAWIGGLRGADAEEGRALLAELVGDWAREADGDRDIDAISRIQHQSLERAGAGQDPPARLATLRLIVVERQVHKLGARTYALAVSVVDGAETDLTRAQGRQLLEEAEALAKRIRGVTDPEAAGRLQRDLGEASMEALYVVERKAMSLRLNRYIQSKAGGSSSPPPVLR